MGSKGKKRKRISSHAQVYVLLPRLHLQYPHVDGSRSSSALTLKHCPAPSAVQAKNTIPEHFSSSCISVIPVKRGDGLHTAKLAIAGYFEGSSTERAESLREGRTKESFKRGVRHAHMDGSLGLATCDPKKFIRHPDRARLSRDCWLLGSAYGPSLSNHACHLGLDCRDSRRPLKGDEYGAAQTEEGGGRHIPFSDGFSAGNSRSRDYGIVLRN